MDPGVVRVVRSNPLKWNKRKYFFHTFSCEKRHVKQQLQLDNVGRRLSKPPLTKSWIRPWSRNYNWKKVALLFSA